MLLLRTPPCSEGSDGRDQDPLSHLGRIYVEGFLGSLHFSEGIDRKLRVYFFKGDDDATRNRD